VVTKRREAVVTVDVGMANVFAVVVKLSCSF
jgi:hypothetical protein